MMNNNVSFVGGDGGDQKNVDLKEEKKMRK